MNFKLIKVLFLSIAILLSTSSFAKTIHLGIVLDANNPYHQNLLATFKSEIEKFSSKEKTIRIDSTNILYSQNNPKLAFMNYKSLNDRKNIDIIVMLGFISSHSVTKKNVYKKPTIAPFLSKTLSKKLEKKANLNYISSAPELTNEFLNLKELKKLKQIAFVDSAVNLNQYKPIKNSILTGFSSRGINAKYLYLDKKNFDLSLKQLKGKQLILIGNVHNLTATEESALINFAIKNKIPTVSLLGRQLVEKGVLLSTYSDSKDINYHLRKTAVNIQRIILGDKPEDISSEFMRKNKLVINLHTANAIGYSPSWKILDQAEVIGKLKSINKKISFNQAIGLALKENLDLRARKELLESQSYKVKQAYNNLFPQVDLTVSNSKVNEEQASFSRSEEMVSSKLSVTQIVYDNDAYEALDIIQNDFKLNKANTSKTTNSIIQLSAKTYFQLLSSQLVEDIEIRNLKQIRLNLDLAKYRKKIGATNISDVYRWQLEESNAQKSVVSAKINTNKAFDGLNRVLNLNLNSRYKLENIDQENSVFKLLNHKFAKAKSPKELMHLASFLMDEATTYSPTIKESNLNEKIVTSQLSITQGDFYSPTLSLTGDVTKIHSRAGLNDAPNGVEDNNWSVSLNLTFPIFEGGTKISKYKENVYKLKSVKLQNRIEKLDNRLNIRNKISDLFNLNKSIGYNKKSAIIANKNYKLVKNRYKNGKISIIELLDAQNTARDSMLLSVNSIYSFLISYVELQNFVGYFDFTMSDSQYSDWEKRFINFK